MSSESGDSSVSWGGEAQELGGARDDTEVAVPSLRWAVSLPRIGWIPAMETESESEELQQVETAARTATKVTCSRVGRTLRLAALERKREAAQACAGTEGEKEEEDFQELRPWSSYVAKREKTEKTKTTRSHRVFCQLSKKQKEGGDTKGKRYRNRKGSKKPW